MLQIAADRSSSATIRAMTASIQSVQIIEITPRHSDQRLDNFLIGQLKGVPKSRVYKLLRSGQVRVNKGRKKPDYRLKIGDQVRIPPVTLSDRPESPLAPAHLLEQVQQSIIYEDDAVLALNKPAGLAVHAGSEVRFGIIEILRQLRPDAEMLELVHRLDRDTSGCLILAKTRPALMQLHEQFRDEHALEKIYRAILVGRWRGDERTVDAPLFKNTLQGGERMVVVDEEQGKSARSVFMPQALYANATLMDIRLLTGRTHQIRVHAAHVGHPVAGDSKYGDSAFNKFLKQQGFKRMFLHAMKLRFTLDDKAYVITAPVDDTWQQLIDVLQHA